MLKLKLVKVVVPKLKVNLSYDNNVTPDFRCAKCCQNITEDYKYCPACGCQFNWQPKIRKSKELERLLDKL